MEQRSRAQKYQQLRQNLAVETENTVKSRDLSRYARQMESFKTPATQEFQYEKQEPVVGTRSRAASEYLNEIQKESDAIDEIVRANEELMNETPVSKPAVASRAQRFASMFMVDEEEDIVVQPKVEEVKVEDIVEELVEVLPVEEPVVEEVAVEEDVEEPVVEEVFEEIFEEATVEEVVEEPVVEEVFEEETVEEPVVEEVFEEETVEEPVVEEVFEEIFEEATAEEPVEESTVEEVFEEVEEDFDIDSYEEEPVIKDHFMDDILLEAKKYSVDMGQRAAIDTTATILSELTQSEQEPIAFELEETADDSFDLEFAAEIEGLLNDPATENVEEAEVVEEPEELQAQIEAIINDNITAPFFEEDEEVEEVEIEEEAVEEVEPEEETVVENTQNNSIISHEIERDDYMELTMKLDQERIFREEMMQKTKQMKLQLDEYETELNTVSNKVSHTNMVLNFVLILLILALFCLLGFIAYWALVDRGLIGAVEVENAFETFAMFVGNWL
ncbi:MAG: hypothetical protein IJO78_04230 [Erysipelotrichaceae bacterium]|nr:hypothetical protein [Erysipelotrichaceae bacterium]